MLVIGRREEKETLLRCERSGKSELVCVYGRRRVGKTFLVEQTFSGNLAFRATGVESENTGSQLKAFHQRLKDAGDTTRAVPRNWFEAFSRLEKLLLTDKTVRSSHGKKIIFLDEFPWFSTPRSDFLTAFSEFWNRCGTEHGDLMMIVCGSATSWIIGNMIESTGSLYNRVTCQLFLRPFTLSEAEQYFRDRDFGWSRKQITECQMVFGGLPYFLDLLNPDESLGWNIDKLCLHPHALLRNESSRLLEATLRKSSVYDAILRLLAVHPYGLEREDCRSRLAIPAGTFSRALDELEKCGYIMQYKKQSQRNHPHQIRLVDAFLLFHYHFLDRADGETPESFSAFVADVGRYNNWRGHAFENLCLSHLSEIRKALGVSGIRTKEYPWTGKSECGGAQIDLVIERADQITDLCEIKYTDQPLHVTAEMEQVLLHKLHVFREVTGTKQTLKTVMISAEGIAGTAHTERIARILTLDDLF